MKASYIKNQLLKSVSSIQDNPAPFVKHAGRDFTRKRKCPLSSVIYCILTTEAHSLNREIRRYFSCKNQSIPTKSAFCQQRAKLNDTLFPFLLSELNRIPFQKTLNGYHLLACDGSDVNIPPQKDCSSTFVRSNTEDVGYYQVHLNALYDVLEKRYTDIYVQPRAEINERAALKILVERNFIKDKCLYIADRGYFSLDILAMFLQSQQKFLLRLPKPDAVSSFLHRFALPDADSFDVPLPFYFSRTRSQKKTGGIPVVFLLPHQAESLIPPQDHSSKVKVSLRLVKLKLSSGEYEYLLTNLPKKEASTNTVTNIYHLRWGIETSFRYLKYNAALTSFHSVRRDFIIQEIYARIILYNFTQLILATVSIPEKRTKYNYMISVSDAIAICRDFLIQRWTHDKLEKSLLRYLIPVKPGRAFPRKVRSKRYIPFTNRT